MMMSKLMAVAFLGEASASSVRFTPDTNVKKSAMAMYCALYDA